MLLIGTTHRHNRQVCYPSDAVLRDYLAWRQADCHINNQYNAVFWALVGSGLSRTDAQARLAGTQTADKNELLFSGFGVSYASLPEMHRRGSVLRRARAPEAVKTRPDGEQVVRLRTRVVVEHCDIIGDTFWSEHPELLAG
jgi:tRNA(His) guanylyltransferase